MLTRHSFAICTRPWCAGVELRCQRRSGRRGAGEGENLEKTARRVRYGWLAEVALERGLRRVATGHTADDQAETVLHRLLRGTGLKGLRGIAARRPLSGSCGLTAAAGGDAGRSVDVPDAEAAVSSGP